VEVEGGKQQKQSNARKRLVTKMMMFLKNKGSREGLREYGQNKTGKDAAEEGSRNTGTCWKNVT
jgi:hypothetical protein